MIQYSINNALYLDVCKLNKGDNDKYIAVYSLYDETIENTNEKETISCIQISEESNFSSGIPKDIGWTNTENNYGNSIIASNSGDSILFFSAENPNYLVAIPITETSLSISSGDYIIVGTWYTQAIDSINIDSGNYISSYRDTSSDYWSEIANYTYDENTDIIEKINSTGCFNYPKYFNCLSKLDNENFLLFSIKYPTYGPTTYYDLSCAYFQTSGGASTYITEKSLDKFSACFGSYKSISDISTCGISETGSCVLFSDKVGNLLYDYNDSQMFIGYVGLSGSSEIYHADPLIIESGLYCTNLSTINYENNKVFISYSFLEDGIFYGKYCDLSISGENFYIEDSGIFDTGVISTKLSTSPSGDVIIFYGKNSNYEMPEEIQYKNYAAYKDITIHYDGLSAGEDETTDYLTDIFQETYFYWTHDETYSYVDYFQISFNKERIVKKYSMTSYYDEYSYYDPISSWTIKGSNDQSTWYEIDSESNQIFTETEEISYDIINESGYKYYRIYPSGEDSNSYAMSQIKLYAEKEMNDYVFDYATLDDSVVAAYPCEEQSGNIFSVISDLEIEDTSSNNQYGNYGKNNYCLYNDGYMNYQRPLHDTFSFSFWMNLEQHGAIFWLYTDIFIGCTSDGYFYISGDLGTDTSSIEFNIDTWYFVAVTRDSDTGEFNMYVNGQYVCGGILTTPGTISLNTTRNVAVWRNGGSSFQSGYAGGYLDEIYWFDKVLTNTEILWLYNSADGNYIHEPEKNEGPNSFIYGIDTNYKQKINRTTGGGITKLRAFDIVGGQFYSYSTADNRWNISYAIPYDYIDTSLYINDLRSIFFKSDGLKIYILEYDGNIKQYSLGEAWSISTLNLTSEASITYSGASNLWFSIDGSKMFFICNNDYEIKQWSLSTPWDLSTATAETIYDFSSYGTNARGLCFSNDGYKMYISSRNDNKIYQFSLSESFNIADTTYDEKYLDYSDKETENEGIFLNNTGKNLYITGFLNSDYITQYLLETENDISTATFVRQINYNYNSYDITCSDIKFYPYGDYMYLTDAENSIIHQYYIGSKSINYQKIYGDLIWDGSNNKYEFYADENRKYKICEKILTASSGTNIETSGTLIGDGMKIVFDYDLS